MSVLPAFSSRKLSLWISFAMLLTALYGGTTVIAERLQLLAMWHRLPTSMQEAAALGPLAPVVANVRRHVPPEEGLLLSSRLDPALLPYVLFPRKIWQTQTDPETNAFYMELTPSPFPLRAPEDFPVSWRLYYAPENASAGGELGNYPQQDVNR